MRALRSTGWIGALAALVAAICTFADVARAGEPRADGGLTRIAGSVRAGDTIELRWGELPGDADELEILLSLDDGEHYPIRVSPELEAEEGVWRWRVPNLPAERARLRLRVGNGRGRERWLEPGEAFRIVGSPGRAAEASVVREAPWWLGVEDEAHGETRSISDAPGEQISALRERPAATTPTSADAALDAAPSTRLERAKIRRAIERARPVSFTAPRTSPLRN